MNQISINPCGKDQLHTLQDIAINSYGDHYLYLWYDGGMWYIDKSFSEEALNKELADSNAAFFLIYEADNLVGFLKLNLHKALDGHASEGEGLELERIYLSKAAAGRGIGREALDFTKRLALENNKKLIWLKAMDSSSSIGFYEQNGFKKCGTHTLTYEHMKPEYRGMHVMKLAL